MSLSKHTLVWNVAEEDRARSAELAQALQVPRLTAHLLMLRGIEDPESGRAFLNPSLDTLADPFLLTDMEKAVDRLRRALQAGERVRICGDYDVDGITGTALLYFALRRAGFADCDCTVPSRITEGYGITPEHVDAAHEAGVTVIVTVDNGIAAREAAARAREAGIDLIVTDHHPIEGDLPDAFAIVNPKRPGSQYPGYDASGVAVAFHLARALTGECADLDLVALGTIADVVPLRGENRILAAAGLDQMRRNARVGVKHLAAVADLDLQEVTAEKVAFQLGPRLNAAGRLGDSRLPLDLMLTESPDEARRMAWKLNDANDRRRIIERTIYDDAVRRVEGLACPDRRSIVLASREWHAGVVGIVAARLQTRYNRPVVLVAVGEDGVGRGSARSIEGFDMAGALGNCREHLVRFGGHAAAAGLTIVEQYIKRFQASFEEEAGRRFALAEFTQKLDIDAQVSLSELDSALVGSLDRLEPFGAGNRPPLFCAYRTAVTPNSLREMQQAHLRVSVKQGGRVFTAVGWRMSDAISNLRHAAEVDIAFSPRFNTWRGETSIQLILKDIRASEVRPEPADATTAGQVV